MEPDCWSKQPSMSSRLDGMGSAFHMYMNLSAKLKTTGRWGGMGYGSIATGKHSIKPIQGR